MSITNSAKREPLNTRSKKRTAIILATILTLSGAGVAVAYWTSGGSGTGTATTGVSTDFVVTSETAVGDIAPGNAGQTVEFTVMNPADSAQYLTSVTVEIADGPDAPWVPNGDCSIADYSATVTTAPTYGDIPAGGSVTGVATVTLENTSVNQDSCQGQAVPLYFVAR